MIRRSLSNRRVPIVCLGKFAFSNQANLFAKKKINKELIGLTVDNVLNENYLNFTLSKRFFPACQHIQIN